MPIEKFTPTYTFTEDRLQQLKQVVPEAFADGKINWKTLREALGDYLEDEEADAEHFGLTWPGKRGIYDKVQIDSDVERGFVNYRLREDEDNSLCYFKFPPKFKIPFPKIIGNYNPDWGIVRKAADGKPVLELVRETKGTTDVTKLQFTHEQRKIRCAQHFFETIGVS